MKTLTLTLVVSALLALCACNTVEGFGRDMQQGGKHIEKAADKA